MAIEMPEGLPFSVDTWSPSSIRKRHHFLTHAHKDHSQGIITHASYPIYSTPLTKSLLLQQYPKLDESLFVSIEIGQSLLIHDPHGDFTLTAFDANHCPGSAMFLFEGEFGNILHTGDCRLTTECLQSLPEKYITRNGKNPNSRLDFIFLDCTFGKFLSPIPTKQSAIQQIINCIWKHPNSPIVYLACDLLGLEEILVKIFQTFGCKIYVDKEKNPEYFQSLTLLVPKIVSSDPNSRFQVLDSFPKLYERAEAKILEARANFQQEPLIIRPSVQWYALQEGFNEKTEKRKRERFNEAVKDSFGVWHVCYSIHSSKDELEWALQLIAPKWVVSTTISCRAMELDYVNKHCFISKVDHIWKLLNIEESKVIVKPTSPLKPINLSPPSKTPCHTLFGRVRLGQHDSSFKHDKQTISNVPEMCVTETKCDQVEIKLKNRPNNYTIGSSSSFNESLRKFYGSMNVPVPQPLPSLVELMKANKRAKRKL